MPANPVDVNLLGHEDLAHSSIGRIVTWVTTYGRYIMILTEIVVLLAFISRFSLDRRLTDLNEEIAQKQAILQANLPFENEIRNLQDRLAKVKPLVAEQIKVSQAFSLLVSILPSDVYLQTYEYSGDRIKSQAIAGTTFGFAQFLSNLSSLKQFTDIEIGNINKRPIGGIQFQFTVKLTGVKAGA